MISTRALKFLSATSVLFAFSTISAAQIAREHSTQELNEFDQREQLPNGKGWGAAHDRQSAASNSAAASVPEQGAADPVSQPDGMPPRGQIGTPTGAAAPSQIKYHGGPVMLGTTNVYFIWYGDWSRDRAAQNLLPEFVRALGGTRWYNINTTYKNKAGQHVANSVHFGGNTFNTSSYKNLNDGDVQKIVTNAINSGALPKDSHGVYFVLTAPDVKETSGFCSQYCGWHTHAALNGSDIKYGFIGNPSQQCAASCEAQTSRSPNGDPASDAMASTIAHELSESATDPDLNAWFDNQGNENADKCAWQFGGMFAATNGAQANVNVGTRQWLIQENWVNATKGYCAKAY